MNYLYLASLIFLFVLFVILKKNDNKRNIIITLVYTVNILYCLNIAYTFVLSVLGIKNTFLVLSIINILVSIIVLTIHYHKYKKLVVQKYYINPKELVSLCILIAICFMIGLNRFDNFTSISYETTDPAVHYMTSTKYNETLVLHNKVSSSDEIYNNFDRMMPGYYVNCGLFLRIFDGISDYKTYMIFDTLILMLMAVTFYITCLSIKEVKNNNVIVLLITILYFGAYSLNNFIFGFGYLGIGMLSTNLILLTWNYIEKNKKEKNKLYCLLFLFNFALFFSYYLFVPVVYLAQGLYIIFKWLKHKKTFKEIFKLGIFILIIPFLIGFIYFMLPGLLATGETVMSTGLANEGYIYRDLWSNFILILPLIVYSLVLEVKNKKYDINIFFIVIELLFIILTFILGMNSKVSSYYYFKSYFILWLFFYIYIVKLVNYNEFNIKTIFKINIYFIVFIIAISLFKIETKIQEKNILFNNTIVSPNVINIYLFNDNKINEDTPILTNKELDVIEESKEYYNICISNNEFPVVGNYLQKLWFYSITNVVPIYDHISYDLSKFYDDNFEYNKFIEDEQSNCLIVFNRFNNVNNENYIEIKKEDYEILYENEDGVILKKY